LQIERIQGEGWGPSEEIASGNAEVNANNNLKAAMAAAYSNGRELEIRGVIKGTAASNVPRDSLTNYMEQHANTRTISLFELCHTYEVSSITVNIDGEAFRFRIELFRTISSAPSAYYARIYRREHFRIQPTFPQVDGEPSLPEYDKLIFVEDEFLIDWESTKSECETDCIEKVLGRIRYEFNIVVTLG